jgi:hypothetical protein
MKEGVNSPQRVCHVHTIRQQNQAIGNATCCCIHTHTCTTHDNVHGLEGKKTLGGGGTCVCRASGRGEDSHGRAPPTRNGLTTPPPPPPSLPERPHHAHTSARPHDRATIHAHTARSRSWGQHSPTCRDTMGHGMPPRKAGVTRGRHHTPPILQAKRGGRRGRCQPPTHAQEHNSHPAPTGGAICSCLPHLQSPRQRPGSARAHQRPLHQHRHLSWFATNTSVGMCRHDFQLAAVETRDSSRESHKVRGI